MKKYTERRERECNTERDGWRGKAARGGCGSVTFGGYGGSDAYLTDVYIYLTNIYVYLIVWSNAWRLGCIFDCVADGRVHN